MPSDVVYDFVVLIMYIYDMIFNIDIPLLFRNTEEGEN